MDHQAASCPVTHWTSSVTTPSKTRLLLPGKIDVAPLFKPPRLPLAFRDLMVGVVVAVMLTLVVGSGALLVAQTPTMREIRPAPKAETPPRPAGDDNLRDQYNVTVPGLVVSAQELKVDVKEMRNDVNEMRSDSKLARADIDRILSYLSYLAGLVSALFIGVVLQIYQSHQNGRMLRADPERSRGGRDRG